MANVETGLDWVRKNIPIAVLAVGLVGAAYVTQERVTAHETRLAKLEGWQQATQLELAGAREREKITEASNADLKVTMEGVQRTLGTLQLTLARLCAGLKVRCE